MDSNKVNVVGWYNKKNVGDESYKLSFKNIFPNYDFTFSENPIKGHSAYILGGGDIVTEQNLKKFINIQEPKHIMSVTISSNIEPNLLKPFRNIIVRDNKSQEKLKNIGFDSFLFPDFGFCLSGDESAGNEIIKKQFENSSSDLYAKKIAIVVNSHILPTYTCESHIKSRFDKFCYDLAITIDQTPASFVFVPFGTKMPWDDRITNAAVHSKCKYWKKNSVFFEELSFQSILDIFSACDAIVSTRLHSSIFSISCEKPFLDITHSHKNSQLLETLSLKELSINYNEYSTEKGSLFIKHLLNNNEVKNKVSSINSMNLYALSNLKSKIIIN